jgi:hypothetical protein
LDELTGGLHGTMIFAGADSNNCDDLACSLTLAALQRNPRLGAIICTLGKSKRDHQLALAARASGVDWSRIDRGQLSDDEEARLKHAWERYCDRFGRRIRFWGPIDWNSAGCFIDHRVLGSGVLAEREEFLRSRKVDRCLIVIDRLPRVEVCENEDPEAGDGPDRPLASYRVVNQRRWQAALDISQGMPGWSDHPRDPVLAVTGVCRNRGYGLKPANVLGWPLDGPSAVGLLGTPWRPNGLPAEASRMTLDISTGGRDPSVSIPLQYDHASRRFTDVTSNRGIGW